MITDGVASGRRTFQQDTMAILGGRRFERLSRALFWTLLALSPIPAELAMPTLRLLADLGIRVWTRLRNFPVTARIGERLTKPAFGKWPSFAN